VPSPPRAHTRADGAEAGLTVLREASDPQMGGDYFIVFDFFNFLNSLKYPGRLIW
jgi:hypothetical protein